MLKVVLIILFILCLSIPIEAKQIIYDDLDLDGNDLTSTGGDGYLKDLTLTGTATSTAYIIGANTLDTNEWGFLDGQDQSVKSGTTPGFNRVYLGVSKITYLDYDVFVFDGALSIYPNNDPNNRFLFQYASSFLTLFPAFSSSCRIGKTGAVFTEGWFDNIKSDGDITITPTGGEVSIVGNLEAANVGVDGLCSRGDVSVAGKYYGDGSALTNLASGGGAWDIDVNGGLMPAVTVNADDYWELDVNNDLMPKI